MFWGTVGGRLVPMPGMDVPARYPPFREWTVIPPEWETFVYDKAWLEPHLDRFGAIAPTRNGVACPSCWFGYRVRRGRC